MTPAPERKSPGQHTRDFLGMVVRPPERAMRPIKGSVSPVGAPPMVAGAGALVQVRQGFQSSGQSGTGAKSSIMRSQDTESDRREVGPGICRESYSLVSEVLG